VIKRAQPIADGDNPVCQTVHKRSYRRCVCVEGQKLLEQKDRVHAYM